MDQLAACTGVCAFLASLLPQRAVSNNRHHAPGKTGSRALLVRLAFVRRLCVDWLFPGTRFSTANAGNCPQGRWDESQLGICMWGARIKQLWYLPRSFLTLEQLGPVSKSGRTARK